MVSLVCQTPEVLLSPSLFMLQNIIPILTVHVYNRLMYSVKEAAYKLGLDASQVRHLLAKDETNKVKLTRD